MALKFIDKIRSIELSKDSVKDLLNKTVNKEKVNEEVNGVGCRQKRGCRTIGC